MGRVAQMSFTGFRTRDVLDWFDEEAITFDQAQEMLSVNEGTVKNCPECGEFIPGEPEQRWHMEYKHPAAIGERLREAKMCRPVRAGEHIHDWRVSAIGIDPAGVNDSYSTNWECSLCNQHFSTPNPHLLPRPNFRFGDFDPSVENGCSLPPPRELDYEHAKQSLQEWINDDTE